MIRPRLTDPLRVISATDPALAGLPKVVIQAYCLSRRVEDLGDLSGLDPTIWFVSPLLVEHENQVAIGTPASARFLLREHPLDVVGADWIKFDVDKTGRRRPTTESVDSIPIEIVMELYQVIVEAQRGGDQGAVFTPPDTFVRRRQLAELREKIADFVNQETAR